MENDPAWPPGKDPDAPARAGGPRKGARSLELLAAAVLLAWRLASLSPAAWGRDWAVLLCLYWIAAIFVGKSKAWPWVTVGLSGVLLAVYAAGHLPPVLELLGVDAR